MRHVSNWTCRSCRAVLGQVRDGVLHPTVAVESVDGREIGGVACQQCGRAWEWEPTVQRTLGWEARLAC